MANILGVNTGEFNLTEIKNIISSFYNDNSSHLIVTPNPEIILSAQKDEELFYLLNKADLSLADGFGLKIGAWLSGQKLKRVTGADLLPYLLQEAEKEKRKVLIINRQGGLSSDELIVNTLKREYPNLDYLIINSPLEVKVNPQLLEQIKKFQADLAICLFGSPTQEKYLHNLQKVLTNLSIAVGLGGAFDFLSGQVTRAPLSLRRLGLEWLWRLIQQPSRLPRMWRATVVFTSKLLYWRLIMPLLYRPNVAVLMYKNTPVGRAIFIVERQGEPNHWQLPQGGLDGESLITAGSRELREESGAINFKVINTYRNLHRYEFNKEGVAYSLSRSNRHFGYRGQKQSLLIAKFTGDDSEIKINYWDHQAWDWVLEKDFINKLHPCRQKSGKIYLEKLKQIIE